MIKKHSKAETGKTKVFDKNEKNLREIAKSKKQRIKRVEVTILPNP